MLAVLQYCNCSMSQPGFLINVAHILTEFLRKLAKAKGVIAHLHPLLIHSVLLCGSGAKCLASG